MRGEWAAHLPHDRRADILGRFYGHTAKLLLEEKGISPRNVGLVKVESTFVNVKKGARSVFILVNLLHEIAHHMQEEFPWAEFKVFAPGTVKKSCTGKGNASKEQVRRVVTKRYRLKRFLDAYTEKEKEALCDAIAIAGAKKSA